jgi:hypothetical protein
LATWQSRVNPEYYPGIIPLFRIVADFSGIDYSGIVSLITIPNPLIMVNTGGLDRKPNCGGASRGHLTPIVGTGL